MLQVNTSRFDQGGGGAHHTVCQNRWHPAGKGSLGSRRACLCGGFHLGHGNSSVPASLQTAHDLMGGICPCGPNKRPSKRFSSRMRKLVRAGRHKPFTTSWAAFTPEAGRTPLRTASCRRAVSAAHSRSRTIRSASNTMPPENEKVPRLSGRGWSKSARTHRAKYGDHQTL